MKERHVNMTQNKAMKKGRKLLHTESKKDIRDAAKYAL